MLFGIKCLLAFSGGASIKILGCKWARPSKSHRSGFDHFVQENAHFFIISDKVSPCFLDFTESWGQTGGGAKQTFRGAFATPLAPLGVATVYICRRIKLNPPSPPVCQVMIVSLEPSSHITGIIILTLNLQV